MTIKIGIRKQEQESMATCDYNYATNIEVACQTLGSKHRAYVKDSYMGYTTPKTKKKHEQSCHANDEKIYKKLAQPIKTPMQIFQYLHVMANYTDSLETYNYDKCDPCQVIELLDNQNRVIAITQHLFCNILKQVITNTTSLECRKMLGIDNTINQFCDQVWLETMICQEFNNKTLMALEQNARLLKLLDRD